MTSGSIILVVSALCCRVSEPPSATVQPPSSQITIGAKNFTESAVLAELMAQVIEEETDLAVERRMSLGGTMICWTALQTGEIDIYAEYTGTGWATVLQETGKISDPLRTFFEVRRRYLDLHDIHWLDPFGLNNSYALAMTEAKAAELDVSRISDLLEHQAEIRTGFSIEFNSRADGYPGLVEAYGFDLNPVTIEHGLAYQAVASGDIDLMDAYSTDGKLLRYKLRVLEDDRGFFPPYHAAPLVRGDTLEAHPEIHNALAQLSFRISDTKAQALNYMVETNGETISDTARAFLELEKLVPENPETESTRQALQKLLDERPEPGSSTRKRSSWWSAFVEKRGELAQLLVQHLGLTAISVALASLFAIPLGILMTTRRRLRQIALSAAGVLQTIPSLALLAFLIPLLGLDVKAAIAALFLYALLPILRNTYTGLVEVDKDLLDAGTGMGLTPVQILWYIQLPLALRTIMAGVRTATVISIGVATLAAFIGAGGLGQPIVEGLYLNDTQLILFGAIPAAVLAILADLVLGRLETLFQPRTRSTG